MKNFYIVVFMLITQLFFAQTREANDCVNYIQICGNQAIQLNPSGAGIPEIGSNVCNGYENNSLWLKFTAKTSGTIGFDLIPASPDIIVDYDFWIFGPNATCGKLGKAIRCSTTNPAAAGSINNHTGMDDLQPSDDFFEGPGELGDNYVRSLTVTAGESYFLVIDRPIGDGAFSLNWTGTATLLDPFSEAPNSFGIPPQIKVCNPTELYNLNSFSALILNSNPNFNVSYYSSYEDANYDENKIINPLTLTQNKYFYRIQSSTSECFQVGKINVTHEPLLLAKPTLKACKIGTTATFNLNSAVVTSETIASIKFYTTQQAAIDHLPGTEIPNPANYPSNGGKVYAWVKITSGCENSTEINLDVFPVPNVDTSLFNQEYCDENFDGKITVNLASITSTIVSNAADFDVVYYLASNPSQTYTTEMVITGNTSVVVEVKSKNGCTSVKSTIQLKLKPQVSITTPIYKEVCDNALSGKIDIKLSDYISDFNSTGTANYFSKLEDAKNNINFVSDNQTISNDISFYYRFEKTGECPIIGTLNIKTKKPLKSTNLPSELLICKDQTIDLNAGSGFDSYLWSNGSTNQTSGLVGVGEYWVELGYNGCVYKQSVSVKETPGITLGTISIENNTLTVAISSGTPPYEFSLDGINWQFSNTFSKLPKGISNLHIKTALGCEYIYEIYNVNLINAITPNHDGKNDNLDFSALKSKQNVKFTVFDRLGRFISTSANNQLVWDGRENGKLVSTGTYWYILEWIEPANNQKFTYNSWVLVKNR